VIFPQTLQYMEESKKKKKQEGTSFFNKNCFSIISSYHLDSVILFLTINARTETKCEITNLRNDKSAELKIVFTRVLHST